MDKLVERLIDVGGHLCTTLSHGAQMWSRRFLIPSDSNIGFYKMLNRFDLEFVRFELVEPPRSLEVGYHYVADTKDRKGIEALSGDRGLILEPIVERFPF